MKCHDCSHEVSNRALSIFYLAKQILLGKDPGLNAMRIQDQVRLLEKYMQEVRKSDTSISGSDENI